jgi:hypothetical protein
MVAIGTVCACSSGGGVAPSDPPTTRVALPALSKFDTNQISRAFVIFFDGRTSAATAATKLQNGVRFAAALRAQASSQQAKTLSAKVVSVGRDPQHPGTNVAKVTFSLLSGGQVLLPNAPGYAVRADGRWLVAAQTFCALLRLQAAPPQQCSDRSLTALPPG